MYHPSVLMIMRKRENDFKVILIASLVKIIAQGINW